MVPQKLKYIFILFIVALVALQGFDMIHVARADTVSEMELRLFTLINTARTDPLGTAASLGLDPEQVLRNLPELEEILTEGLPPLEDNDLLHISALGHTQDMLTQNYFSKMSLDGRSPYYRIENIGYDPDVTGETLGILAFYNFIGSETAVNILFKNMFLDELNPERVEPRNILDPEFQDMGIGIGTGVMDLGSGRYNVYLVTSDFASNYNFTMEDAEMALLHLINQAREKPLTVAASLGIDSDQLLADLPELAEVLTKGLQPLGLNQNLQRTARLHSQEMVDDRYFDHDSPDGKSFEERIRESGYDPMMMGESLWIEPIDKQAALEDSAQTIFERMFLAELDRSYTGQRNILNPDFSEVGIGLGELNPEPDEYFDHSFLVTCDFGSPSTPAGLYLMGLIYTDIDGDGQYTPGEGIPGMDIYIDYPNVDFEVKSDRTGSFQLLLGPGPTRVVLWPQDAYKEFWVEIKQDNARFVYRDQP
jgi:uncharacterized protein YkwD